MTLDSKPRIAVIGAGAFGGWTALRLQERGADVVLVDHGHRLAMGVGLSPGLGRRRLSLARSGWESALSGSGTAATSEYGTSRSPTRMVFAR